MKFPLIQLSGTVDEIGFQHGSQLKDRIHETINYYSGIFKQPEHIIFEKATIFKQNIQEFNPQYCTEIEAIARGAEVDPMWIYALNARSEILNLFRPECTALYSSANRLLAQNWDWAEKLEELTVILKITKTNQGNNSEHTILMISEPGIIGKIGFNSSGLGVTLNFLKVDFDLTGVPIHIMLRALLDQNTIDAGVTLAQEWGEGKSGNIIFGSSDGKFVNFEFTGSEVVTYTNSQYFIHTNHFLKNPKLNEINTTIDNSLSRYNRASEMAKNSQFSIPEVKQILRDQTNTDLPICRPFVPDEELGNLGTICSIIMDLKNKKMILTKGNPFDNPYEEIKM